MTDDELDITEAQPTDSQPAEEAQHEESQGADDSQLADEPRPEAEPQPDVATVLEGGSNPLARVAGAVASTATGASKAIAKGATGAGKAVATTAAGAGRAIGSAAESAGGAIKRRLSGGSDEEVAAAASEEVAETECEPLVRPDPVLDDREIESLAKLTEHYEKLDSPGVLARAAGTVGDLVPDKLKDSLADVGEGISSKLDEQELYTKVLAAASGGFKTLEERAARVTTSPEAVIERANEIDGDVRVKSLDELCFLRSYDIAKVQDKDAGTHLASALVEGAATGAAGVVGIPFNITLSLFLYYRAVQSVAMCYGYDTRNDPAELQIASDVFSRALGVKDGTEHIGKFMAYGQLAVVSSTAKKTWGAMAEKNGLTLLATQIRALANKSAQKALEKAGKGSPEKNIFSDLLEQIGKKLTLKTTGRLVPVVGAVVGGLLDTNTMRKLLDFADTFYNKRFIVEKAERIDACLGNASVDDGAVAEAACMVEGDCIAEDDCMVEDD